MVARATLVEQLSLVEPALASGEHIPILANIAFYDGAVVAYNDRIGLSAPLDCGGFEGVVPGKNLLALLPTSDAEEVTITATNGKAKFEAGDLVIRDEVQALAAFTNFFTMPPVPEDEPLTAADAKKLLRAVSICLRSCTNKTVQASEELGVTLVANQAKQRLSLYSTDRLTISYAITTVPLANQLTQPIILSGEFCRQMVRLGKGAAEMTLSIRDDHVLFVADGVMLFGRLITPSGRVNYPAVIKKNMPDDARRALIDVPEGFDKFITRAGLFDDKALTTIKVNRGKAHFECSPTQHRNVQFDLDMPGHPNVALTLNASLLPAGFDECKKLLFTERCAIFSGTNSYFFVAATARPPT